MEIEEFYNDLRNVVKLRAEVENDFTGAAFMGEVADLLVEVEEVDHLLTMHFEGIGSKKRRLAVDGYDLNDPDGSIALAVLLHNDSNTISKVGMAEARRAITSLENFLRDAVSGDFASGREESASGYQLAEDLRLRGRNVTRYRLYLVTDGQLGDRMKSFDSSELNGVRIDYHLWDIARIFQVRQSTQTRESLDIELNTWVHDGLPAIEIASPDGLRTFLAAVPGDMVADLYSRYGSRLLESNVRSYLSARGKVNKGIQTTILSEPEMFLAYNNGITATATDLTKSAGDESRIKSIRDLQIVNGGQTTASLFYIGRDNKNADLASVRVPMKLVVVDPERAAEIVPKISRFANSQNKVSEVDFFSNSPFHVRMEELSRRVLAPAKAGESFQSKWFYERTRGQYGNERSKLSVRDSKKFETTYPRSQVISKTDAAKYAVSFDGKPHLVSAGAQKNFVAFAELVATKWEQDSDSFNELYFKELVAKAIVYIEFRKLISHADWYEKGYLANIVSYTISKLVSEIERQGDGRRLDLSAIWREQSLTAGLADAALDIGQLVLAELTSDSRAVQNVTEWAKREACWKAVDSHPFTLSSIVLGNLVSGSSQRAAAKEAKATQRIDTGIAAQVEAMTVPAEHWRLLREFARGHRLLSDKELGILNIACSGKLPSERQSEVLLALLERARDAGFKPV